MELEYITRICPFCNSTGVEYIFHTWSIDKKICHVCDGAGYCKFEVKKIDWGKDES